MRQASHTDKHAAGGALPPLAINVGRLCAGLLLGLVCASCALLVPTPEPFGPPANARTTDYLYYYGTEPIGWRRTCVTLGGPAGPDSMDISSHAYISVTRDQDNAEFSREDRTTAVFDATLTEVESSFITMDSFSNRHVTARWGNPIQVSDSAVGPEKKLVPLTAEAAEALSEPAAIRILLASPPDTAKKVRSFDHERLRLTVSTWTYLGIIELPDHNGVAQRGHAIRKGESAKSVVELYDPEGTLMFSQSPGGITMERVARIPLPFVPSRLRVKTALDTDLVIERPEQLAALEFELDLKRGTTRAPEPEFASNDYQSASRTPAGWALQLTAQAAPAEIAFPPRAIERSLVRYMQPTPMFQSDHPDIAAEARRLTLGKKTCAEAVLAIMDFTRQRLAPGIGYAADASAAEAYAARAGDCSEAASLVVALARAANIPARRVKGMIYWPRALDGTKSGACFVYHAWVEVWIGKWTPADPTTGDLGSPARYIWLQEDPDGSTDPTPQAIELVRQNVTPQINYYRRSDGTVWLREGATRRFK